jgi:hypothetical protein
VKRSPLKRKTPLKRGGKLRRVSAKRKARTKSIVMCERSSSATIQSAKCAGARWQAKFTIGGGGLGIG